MIGKNWGGKLEDFIQKSRVLSALAGLVRGILWYFFGLMNKPGAHLLVYANETREVLCVNPATETYMRWWRWSPYVCHIPGGGIDKGESPEVAILREVKEEIGVSKLDLTFAERRAVTIEFGKLRNPVTVFRVNVKSPQDFPVEMSATGEFVSPPAWRPVEDVYRNGTPVMRKVLLVFDLVPDQF